MTFLAQPLYSFELGNCGGIESYITLGVQYILTWWLVTPSYLGTLDIEVGIGVQARGRLDRSRKFFLRGSLHSLKACQGWHAMQSLFNRHMASERCQRSLLCW
jgi:hypothetical protein